MQDLLSLVWEELNTGTHFEAGQEGGHSLHCANRRLRQQTSQFIHHMIIEESPGTDILNAWTRRWPRSATLRHLEVVLSGDTEADTTINEALRFPWMAIQPGAAQLLAGVTKIELRGCLNVDSFDIAAMGRFCPALRSLLLGETGTKWWTDGFGTGMGRLDGGILGPLCGMENLAELQLDLSSLEDETRAELVSSLPSLPATLTDVGLYFSGWELDVAVCVAAAVAVPAGMLRTLLMALADLEEDELDVDIFSGLHNATGLTRMYWLEESRGAHNGPTLRMPSTVRSLILCPALTELELTVVVSGDVAAMVIEMPSLQSLVLVSIIGAPRTIVREVPLQSLSLSQQDPDWTHLLCLGGRRCTQIIKLDYYFPLDEVVLRIASDADAERCHAMMDVLNIKQQLRGFSRHFRPQQHRHAKLRAAIAPGIDRLLIAPLLELFNNVVFE